MSSRTIFSSRLCLWGSALNSLLSWSLEAPCKTNWRGFKTLSRSWDFKNVLTPVLEELWSRESLEERERELLLVWSWSRTLVWFSWMSPLPVSTLSLLCLWWKPWRNLPWVVELLLVLSISQALKSLTHLIDSCLCVWERPSISMRPDLLWTTSPTSIIPLQMPQTLLTISWVLWVSKPTKMRKAITTPTNFSNKRLIWWKATRRRSSTSPKTMRPLSSGTTTNTHILMLSPSKTHMLYTLELLGGTHSNFLQLETCWTSLDCPKPSKLS